MIHADGRENGPIDELSTESVVQRTDSIQIRSNLDGELAVPFEITECIVPGLLSGGSP